MKRFGKLADLLRATAAAAFIVTGISANCAIAQPSAADEKRALSVEITRSAVNAINVQQIIDFILDQIAQSSSNKSDNFRRELNSLAPLLKEEFNSIVVDITNLAAKFYEERFEVSDLKQIRDFYASSAGQKLNGVNAEFGARLGVISEKIIGQRVPALEAKIKAELLKRGFKL